MNVIAVIPARSGSKRVPNKNIRDFHGKPLIAWAIEAANSSSRIKRTVVSTNDQKIADIAKKYGAEVPFLRPEELATDTSDIEPVLAHLVEELEKEGEKIDALLLLMPTNPLRKTEHIDEAVNLFQTKKVTSVVAVHEAPGNRNPHWMLTENSGGICLFNGSALKDIKARSQDLPICYSRNDIVYVINPKNLYENPPNLYGDKIELMIMDDLYDGDINSEEDWHIAHDKFRRHLL